MNTTILFTTSPIAEIMYSAGYIAGAVIALAILVYLFYSLIKPEKF